MAHPDRVDGQQPGIRLKDPIVPGFRELPPVDYWGGSVSVPESEKPGLLQTLTQVSQESGFTFTGFLASTEGKTTYTFTRYPRHARGIATIDACKNALTTLS